MTLQAFVTGQTSTALASSCDSIGDIPSVQISSITGGLCITGANYLRALREAIDFALDECAQPPQADSTTAPQEGDRHER